MRVRIVAEHQRAVNVQVHARDRHSSPFPIAVPDSPQLAGPSVVARLKSL
jgi:hypothetical protein